MNQRKSIEFFFEMFGIWKTTNKSSIYLIPHIFFSRLILKMYILSKNKIKFINKKENNNTYSLCSDSYG